MYWPIGTPRIFATVGLRGQHSTVSYDGLPSPDHSSQQDPRPAEERVATDLQIPITPATPATPGIRPVDSEFHDGTPTGLVPSCVPVADPILALRISRSGTLFTTITRTSMTIWQSKPTVILAIVVRSEASLTTYGPNVSVLLRPDSAILVAQTELGYLITYSLATDNESRVYKPHFSSHTNIQRRRQSYGGNANLPPDQIMWGPGEGAGVRDISIKFRMVIKVDAGIQTVLALDDELIVATKRPAAVQCIRWTPDESGNQTSTEILSRMGWVDKKVTIVEMTHDRPMNLLTWITSDGKAYAAQRLPDNKVEGSPTKLFKGFCFHTPSDPSDYAIKAAINARFSLIAVGCQGGSIVVFSAKDYSGNIPHCHIHRLTVSRAASGPLTTLSYSPDGYCIFAGFEKGWANWSVFGKLLSSSFGNGGAQSGSPSEGWLSGVIEAGWIGGACELLLIGNRLETVWLLEMARSAVTGCYCPTNVFRTLLHTTSSIMIYRGYDLPDLTTISAEPFLWHTAQIPPGYLVNQWPIRCAVVSPDGRYVAVAGRRGLAHYSVYSGRWKTFANPSMEDEFQVRGGMCWYQHILVAAVQTANDSHELRLYSREAALDQSSIFHAERLSAPVVLITSSGEDSLLVYTYENILYHYIFAPLGDSVRLVQVGQIAFHGIIRSPARVRGLGWILPESQLVEGDPSHDVSVASVLFLVDGKLVLLQPSLSSGGHLKYDMKVIAQKVEFYAIMRDSPFSQQNPPAPTPIESAEAKSLLNSLWMFDGSELRLWSDFQSVIQPTTGACSGELPPTVSMPLDFYPLSILLDKALVLGVEVELIQRRDINFSFFRFAIRSHLLLPELLRFHLTQGHGAEALNLAQHYQHLEYFSHALEMLLHHVLDDEVDSSPTPEDAILPRVLSLLSSFKDYLDIVVQCTRKTEVRSWRTLFAYLPPPQELFEESLLRGTLKTAGGYLLILHTFEELETASEQSVRLLARAMREGDWDLCKELARFLAALDETGDTLNEAMEMAKALAGTADSDGAQTPGSSRLQIPHFRGSAPSVISGSQTGIEGDGQSSDASSLRSTSQASSL